MTSRIFLFVIYLYNSRKQAIVLFYREEVKMHGTRLMIGLRATWGATVLRKF